MNSLVKIPFHKAHITDDEIDAVLRVMKSRWLTMGQVPVEFEQNCNDYIGLKSQLVLTVQHLSLAIDHD